MRWMRALQNLSPSELAPIKSALDAIAGSSDSDTEDDALNGEKDSATGGGGSSNSGSGFKGYSSRGGRRLSSLGGGGGSLVAKNAKLKNGKRKKKSKNNFLAVDPNSIFYLIHRRYQIKRKRKEFLQ